MIVGSAFGLLLGGEGASATVKAIGTPLQFLAFAVILLGAFALLARKVPSRRDLALTTGLTVRDGVILVVVFAVCHAVFWILPKLSGGGDTGNSAAEQAFTESGLGGPLLPAFLILFASVVLAPVCEEILYRVGVVRPIHDHLARAGKPTLGAVLGIAVSTVLFAMPHLGEDATPSLVVSYLLTGAAFGIVYVLTGSLTAAMVSHSLQSCAAFGQILLFGAGDAQVSPILYILVFGCPLWVYLCARGLRAVLPDRSATPSAAAAPTA